MKSTIVLHLTYKQLPPEAAELFFIFTLGAGVDEKTIREDMIFLDTPENDRIVKIRRQRKPPPRPNRDQLLSRILKALQAWIFAQKLILPDMELVLGHENRQSSRRYLPHEASADSR
jgi:hypothetical protein